MIEIKIGDCVDRLKDLADNSVDAIISDPPYGLKFMAKGWDDIGEGAEQREWHRAWLMEAYRVLKPNGVIKAFSGTRTFHHLIAMMEEVGFSELSVEAWAYGSGFPKSHNLAKQFDKKAGVEGEIIGHKPGVSVEDSQGHGGIARGGVGIVQKNAMIPIRASVTDDAKVWEGWGTALKPAWESLCIGYKRVNTES
jgi:site-specific DNA-methyltransferase (adenine-specific)